MTKLGGNNDLTNLQFKEQFKKIKATHNLRVQRQQNRVINSKGGRAERIRKSTFHSQRQWKMNTRNIKCFSTMYNLRLQEIVNVGTIKKIVTHYEVGLNSYG